MDQHKRGWLATLFKPHTKKEKLKVAESFTGYEPRFTQCGSSVMYSNIVMASIKLKANFFSKLEPRYIRRDNGKITTITDTSVSRLLKNPNPYQTTSDFLRQAFFIKSIYDNCFIYPDYYITNGGYRYYTDMYILLPMQTPRVYEDSKGKLKIAFLFNGFHEEVIFDYDEIIVWKNAEDQQYLGGGKYSSNQNVDVLSSIEAYHQIKESIAESAKAGLYFDGVLKVNAYTSDDEKIQAIRDRFISDLKANKGKIPVLDNGADYQALQRNLKIIDASTLKEIKDNILTYEGISVDVLQGKMTTQDKEAIYEIHIEPNAISLGQAMSKIFFSQWQTSHGDEIILYPHKVQLMATSEIVSIIQNTINAGVFKIDEYREMLGYSPLENGEGEYRPRAFNNLDGTTNNDLTGGATNGEETETNTIE